MHPIMTEAIAAARREDLYARAAVERRLSAWRTAPRWRHALAAAALHAARRLDPAVLRPAEVTR